ncbi:MAG TPA: hypothetical protein VGC76_09505 [Pyrinomonadaceae bacterium]|jgi:hypothetical protein
MKNFALITAIYLLSISLPLFSACGKKTEIAQTETNVSPLVFANTKPAPAPSPSPKIPNLQAEFLARDNKITNSPLAAFDFKNYTYPLPRGWQDTDAQEAVLENGQRRLSEERIGLSYVTTKFLDATGDGIDEAFVILKIETAGSAIPQIVYVFALKDAQPALIWYFRTGDRADGGLKNVSAENGEVVVELFGQDRFVLGEVETSKITGDEEQLCCPTYFSRTRYKYNGKDFLMQGKRLTFSIEDKSAPPVENMGEIVNAKEKSKK